MKTFLLLFWIRQVEGGTRSDVIYMSVRVVLTLHLGSLKVVP